MTLRILLNLIIVEINSKIKKLYDKRSDYIHNGIDKTNEEDIQILEQYIICTIKKYIYIGKDKKEILEGLNETGFGKYTKAKK